MTLTAPAIPEALRHQLTECAGRLEAAVGNEVARNALEVTT